MQTFFFSTDSIEIKAEEGKEYITGYASTHDQDLVNDIVTPNCMSDMLTQFNSRNLKCDIEHESLRGDDERTRTLNIAKIPLAKSVGANYDGKGLEIKWEMNPDYKRFDEKGNVTLNYAEVKRMIKNKFLNGFSIAYVPLQTAKKSIDGTMVRLLDKVNLINIALSGNMINPGAMMKDVMLKSMDALDDNVKADMHDADDATVGDHIPEKSGAGKPDLKSKGEKMEEEKKEEQVEAKSESEEKPEQKDSVDLKALTERVEVLEKAKPESESEGIVETLKQIQADQKALKDEVEKLKSTPDYKAVQQDMNAELKGKEDVDLKARGMVDYIS